MNPESSWGGTIGSVGKTGLDGPGVMPLKIGGDDPGSAGVKPVLQDRLFSGEVAVVSGSFGGSSDNVYGDLYPKSPAENDSHPSLLFPAETGGRNEGFAPRGIGVGFLGGSTNN